MNNHAPHTTYQNIRRSRASKPWNLINDFKLKFFERTNVVRNMNYKGNCCKRKGLRDHFYHLKARHIVAVDWSSEADEADVVSMTCLYYGNMEVRLRKIGWHNREHLGDTFYH